MVSLRPPNGLSRGAVIPAGWCLLGVAEAAPRAEGVAVGGHGHVELDGAAIEEFEGGGLGLSVGGPVRDRLWIEGRLDAGLRVPFGQRYGVLPVIRGFITPRDTGQRLGFSGWGGVGLDLRVGPLRRSVGDDRRARPLVMAGLGLDVPVARALHLRVDAGYLTALSTPGGATLSVGLVWRRRRPLPPLPEVAAAPGWDASPSCVWTSTEAAVGYAEAVDRTSAGARSGEGSGETQGGVRLPTAMRGGLLVQASPGDEVTLLHRGAAALAQTVGPDGVLRIPWPDDPFGEVTLRWRGGGVSRVRVFDIRYGHATWTTLEGTPEPVRLQFQQGLADLTPRSLERLVALARDTGGWRWRVQGSHSPEGPAAVNLRLAGARAQRVADRLVFLGVPADQVVVDPPTPPLAGQTPEEQRMVQIVPEPMAPRPPETP